MICPKCKAPRAHRSHRKGLIEHLVGLFAIRPYRCHACEHRFLQFRYSVGVSSAGDSSTEREIRATRSSLKWRRKRREFLLYGTCFLLFLAFLYYITRQRDSSSEGN